MGPISFQISMAGSDGLRTLTQNLTQLIHHHLKQYKQSPLVHTPHWKQWPRFHSASIVRHGLRWHVANRTRVLHARTRLRLSSDEQNSGAVRSCHAGYGIDSGETAGTSGDDEEVVGGDGGSGHVEDEVGGEAQVGKAHAEGLEHKAFSPNSVEEDPTVLGRNGGQFGG